MAMEYLIGNRARKLRRRERESNKTRLSSIFRLYIYIFLAEWVKMSVGDWGSLRSGASSDSVTHAPFCELGFFVLSTKKMRILGSTMHGCSHVFFCAPFI
jgi:hypothetical protein